MKGIGKARSVRNCGVRGDSWGSGHGRLAFVALLGLLALGGTGCQGAPVDEETLLDLSVSARAVQAGDTCVAFQRGAGGDVADAKVSNRQPDKRFGDEPVASISSVNGHQEQVLLRFDTGGIPRHATLTSATLTLWQTNSGRPTSLRAHAVTRPWQEGSITWSGFGAAHAPEVAASLEAPGPAHPAARTLDVSGLVAAWVKQPESNHGLLLAQAEGKTLLDTSESPHLERRPRLEVCYSLPPPVTQPSGTSLLLRVVDASGQPVAGAAVSSGNALFPTDGSGHLLLENLSSGRFFARVDALGFTSASVVRELGEGTHAGHQVRLLPLGNPISFQAEAGGIIATPDVRVAIPANAVVDALGQRVTGPVEVTVVPLDPTTQLAAMPGPLEGTREATAGGRVPLESFFMAEVSLWRQGAPVQLAPGATATLEFVLPEAVASQLQPGATVPAWWFDLDAGHWRQEGQGTIQDSATQPGKRVWVTKVKHFTWWNADAPLLDRSCVDVLVVDGEGQPVADTQLIAEGETYAGLSSARTGSSGRACLEIKRGHTARVFSGMVGRPSSELVRVTGSPEATACGIGPCTPVTVLRKDMRCAPGAYETCPYWGPADTLGQGMCRAGQRRCDVTAMEWSACAGEVLPVAETCESPFDEDCDGVVNEDCTCSDHEGLSCYSGPARTRGVGMCHGGSVGCDLFGNAACVGQRLPQPEDCSTLGDDDCDGSNECQGVNRWLWWPTDSTCGSGRSNVLGLTVDGAGNILVVGALEGSLNLGGGLSLTGDAYDLYVAKFDTNGLPLWGRVIQRHAWSRGSAFIAVEGGGNVVVAGLFGGGLSLGNVSLPGGSLFQPFVLKLSPEGEPLWGQGFEVSAASVWDPIGLSGLSVDASGDIAFTGSFTGTLRIGDTVHTRAPYWNAVYVAKLSGATGAPLWSKSLRSASDLRGVDVAMDAAGDVLLAGSFAERLDIDGTVLTTASWALDIFLAKFAGDTGSARWSRSNRQDSTNDIFPRLGIDGAGNALTVSLIPPYEFRLTKFDGEGQVLWSRVHEPSYGLVEHEGLRMSLDASGNMVLSGTFTVWGRSVSSSAFVALYDANGGFLNHRIHYPLFDYGGPMGGLGANGAAIDFEGNVVLGGSFSGLVNLGAGVVNSCSLVPFVLKMDPTP